MVPGVKTGGMVPGCCLSSARRSWLVIKNLFRSLQSDYCRVRKGGAWQSGIDPRCNTDASAPVLGSPWRVVSCSRWFRGRTGLRKWPCFGVHHEVSTARVLTVRPLAVLFISSVTLTVCLRGARLCANTWRHNRAKDPGFAPGVLLPDEGGRQKQANKK